jgi:hypothetical protein
LRAIHHTEQILITEHSGHHEKMNQRVQAMLIIIVMLPQYVPHDRIVVKSLAKHARDLGHILLTQSEHRRHKLDPRKFFKAPPSRSGQEGDHNYAGVKS